MTNVFRTDFPQFTTLGSATLNRHCKWDNIAILAIWVGSKPPMNVLLHPLKETIERLSAPNTFSVVLPEGTKSFSLALLFGVFDIIAKAPAMNMMQHNGCSVCLHPGQSFGFIFQA